MPERHVPERLDGLDRLERPRGTATPASDLQSGVEAHQIARGSDVLCGHFGPLDAPERFGNIVSCGSWGELETLMSAFDPLRT